MASPLTRKELYDLIWAEPIRTVAARLGISDVGLKKHCSRLDISVPARGYWAKRHAGKKLPQIPLPLRAPGMDDEVLIGGDRWGYWPDNSELMGPLPDPPSFDEPIEAVRERARKLVGLVRVRKFADGCHPAIRRLLDADDRRREEQKKLSYYSSWYEPRFASPVQQRRLRLLNALFFALASAGGRGWTRGDEPLQIGVDIHSQHVRVSLEPRSKSDRNDKSRTASIPDLRFAIHKGSGSDAELQSWEDQSDARLETKLGEIATEILVTAERIYRSERIRRYEWRVRRKAELEEEARQRKIEAERKERELKAMREQKRIDGLLAQASALRQAQDIRAYAHAVRAAVQQGSGDLAAELLDRWSTWALAQADRIDPVKTGAFLRLQGEPADTDPEPPART